MTDPIPLVKLTKCEEVVAYACGKCGIVASSPLRDGDRAEQIAREHCGPWTCEKCGAEHSKQYNSLCSECWKVSHSEAMRAKEEARFKAAIKLTPEEYTGPVFSDDYGHNEGFAESIGEMLDTCEDCEETPPPYVWACTTIPVSLDAASIIDSALDDHHDGCEVDCEDELIEFIAEWNAKQTGATWEPDYSRCIVLSPAGDAAMEAK